MRVQVVDPPAYTPPYDHALCAALARGGADVELVTSRFAYGPVPNLEGYQVERLFYRLADRFPAPGRLSRAAKLAGHPGGMARLRRHSRDADVVHLQWLTMPALDSHLLPRRPRVWTVHDPPPVRGSRSWARAAARMDAIVVHSGAGADSVIDRLAVDPQRVHVIAHGAFEYLTRLEHEQPLPAELAGVEKPVILCFGLIRPYKGVDLLLEAFRNVEDAELWVVGRPMMDIEPLRELATATAPSSRVRFLARFITDPEIPALFRRADAVVLPYREADQSGVLYTALAFGKAIVATDVGGFPDVASHDGALRLVPRDDPDALAAALADVVGNGRERERLERAARAAADGPYSWDRAAALTLDLYRSLLGDDGTAAR